MSFPYHSVNAKRNAVEMTFRKNPSKGEKKVAKLGLGDFVDGQKVVAEVKKVSNLFASSRSYTVYGLLAWMVLT